MAGKLCVVFQGGLYQEGRSQETKTLPFGLLRWVLNMDRCIDSVDLSLSDSATELGRSGRLHFLQRTAWCPVNVLNTYIPLGLIYQPYMYIVNLFFCTVSDYNA